MGGMEPADLRSMQNNDPEAFHMFMLATHCKQMLLHLKLAKHTWRNRDHIQAIVQRCALLSTLQ